MDLARTTNRIALSVLTILAFLAPGMVGSAAASSQEDQKETKQVKAKTETAKKYPKSPVAIGGYCSNSYFKSGEAVKGDPKFQFTYAGEVYYFTSNEAKKTVEADPEKLLPQIGGLCTTALGGMYNNRIPADPTVFDIINGQIFLFSSERAKRSYDEAPESYAHNALVRFEKPALEGYCLIAYQTRNKPVKGHIEFAQRFRTNVYYFSTRDGKEIFLHDPDRYIPQFDAYCAEGVARGKKFPADPQHFAVHNKKTYLFFDAKAKLTGLMNLPELAKKSAVAWEKIKDSQ